MEGLDADLDQIQNRLAFTRGGELQGRGWQHLQRPAFWCSEGLRIDGESAELFGCSTIYIF